MRITSCLFIILLVTLAACSADVSDPVTVPPVTTVPKVVVATKTAVSPTTIPTILPTSLPTFTVTPPPTISSIPIPPTATPSPVYDLPAWINDPETAVLTAVMSLEPHTEGMIGFMNIDSGELFSLPLPPSTSDIYWGQDEKGTYFEFNKTHEIVGMADELYVERVYIATGESQQISHENFGSYWVNHNKKSPDGRFVARITRENDQLKVTLETMETAEIKTLVDPFYDNNSSFLADMGWSSYGNLLSVGRYIRYDNNTSGNGLTIYTWTGDIYRQFKDKRWFIWSPINNYEGLYEQDGDFGARLPCILDVQNGDEICLEEISAWREELNVESGLYKWSYSGEQISFIYWQAGVSGLCFIEIDSREINCPVDWESLGGRNEVGGISYIRHNPDWSPDGHYMQFIINPFSPAGDDGTFTRIVTSDLDGNNLQIWGYGYDASWRPPLPNSEE